ncbi:glycoside hydrolase family 71 protein [Paxillus rubicundulus Ve08.2h10]|uniref:Glycoside hydrolase family 71 protein n=1 Tax=Paxillus rubicundulus Ve08.2h10 TaxID=930991 RepID=A0A0D0E9P8_9AGAM|nr:glycoside hydrolase family 71 protein [Paxillus rubicundulus Ve08.2h10]
MPSVFTILCWLLFVNLSTSVPIKPINPAHGSDYSASVIPPAHIPQQMKHRSLTRRNSTTKYVVAHFMVGNAYPYTVDNWKSDILLAHQSGFDAFALNVGSDSWQPQQVANAFEAAQQSGTGFKLFMSFDMSSLPCNTADDAATLRTYITTYASHPNQFMYNDRVLASTFAGESCKFGQASVQSGWSTQFIQQLSGSNAVYFIPSFFVDPSTFQSFNNLIDGMFNWNSAWPTQVTTSFAGSLTKLVGELFPGIASAPNPLSSLVGATGTDQQYIDALNSMNPQKTYMASVSPWFFTHYSPESYDKNWIYLCDDHLYAKRWESLVGIRDQVDIVEHLTWNDYGESHYIGPIQGAQPNSQAWVDGFDHTGWLNLTSYYAAAFKTGSYPAITKDKIIMWSRPHPALATAPDPVGQPTNFQITQDKVWAIVMAASPGIVTLSTSSTQSQTFNVTAGVTKLSLPIQANGFMHATLQRNGETIIDLQPQNFTFDPNPPSYNFNAYVVASP